MIYSFVAFYAIENRHKYSKCLVPTQRVYADAFVLPTEA